MLINVGGDSATYDEIGNPVSFEFGLADIYINWNGRLVESVSAGIGPISLVNITFQYNSDGIRTKKGDTNYYLSGSTIVGEETNGNVTLYIYDANGSLLGFKYKSATANSWDTYWYEKNIFGDVVAIYDADGTKLVSYVYDAWGNTSVSYHNNATATSPAGKNPFRYRGYSYDSELYMYYLGSRYYYPAIGRFLSADESSYLGANGDLNSYNLFAYCSNNPVMFTDPTGHASKWWEKALDIGAYVISAAVAVGVGAFVSGCTNSKEAAIAAGVATFALVNNATNFAYYTFIADSETDITSSSYQDGYISRWDRLDYVKQQTQEDWYNPTAWIYYSEYNVHMYGYYALSFVDGALDLLGYSQRSEKFTDLLGRAGKADIIEGKLDQNDIWVAVATIAVGLFGI